MVIASTPNGLVSTSNFSHFFAWWVLYSLATSGIYVSPRYHKWALSCFSTFMLYSLIVREIVYQNGFNSNPESSGPRYERRDNSEEVGGSGYDNRGKRQFLP